VVFRRPSDADEAPWPTTRTRSPKRPLHPQQCGCVTLATLIDLECQRRGLDPKAADRVLKAALGALRREEVAREARERLKRNQMRIC
jgi:hypothetical protein